MEADWAVEIGADLPRIAVPWSGVTAGSRTPRPEAPQLAKAARLSDGASGSDAASLSGAARETLSKDNHSADGADGGSSAGSMDGVSFVDLRADPEAVFCVEEARRNPELRRALVALNGPGSPVFTSKCDVFPLAKDEIDPFEFDAEGDCVEGMSCYVDLVRRDPEVFSSFSAQEAWLRQVVKRLRAGDRIRGARVELVLREAHVFAEDGFGVTLYVAGCGNSISAAEHAWQAALDAALTALGLG